MVIDLSVIAEVKIVSRSRLLSMALGILCAFHAVGVKSASKNSYRIRIA